MTAHVLALLTHPAGIIGTGVVWCLMLLPGSPAFDPRPARERWREFTAVVGVIAMLVALALVALEGK